MFLLDNYTQLFEKSDEEFRDLLVYLHVPKAAGNSSIVALKNNFDAKLVRSIQWDDIDTSWNKFIEDQQLQAHNLVSGHFRYKHVIELINSKIDFKLITFIRHPIERIISQYKYTCSDKVKNNKEFKEKFPTFDLYAHNGLGPNVVSRILIQGALSFDDYINKLKKRYVFIGLSEHYDLSMLFLMNYLGFEYKITERKNVTIANDFNQFEISKKTYDYLLEKHSLDVQVYEYFNNMYNDISKQYIRKIINQKTSIIEIA